MDLTLTSSREEYSYPSYSSDVIYKDLIDTSNLWEHDKKLPESKYRF